MHGIEPQAASVLPKAFLCHTMLVMRSLGIFFTKPEKVFIEVVKVRDRWNRFKRISYYISGHVPSQERQMYDSALYRYGSSDINL